MSVMCVVNRRTWFTDRLDLYVKTAFARLQLNPIDKWKDVVPRRCPVRVLVRAFPVYRVTDLRSALINGPGISLWRTLAGRNRASAVAAK